MAVTFDMNGVRLADVPNAGVAKVDPNAKSGNPNHDTRSGKFGGGGKKDGQAEAPANTQPEEFARMMDAVRTAAREFDNPDIGDVTEFIRGHAKKPDQVDVNGFLAAVQQQRQNDMLDIFDQQLRSSGSMAQGRRKVKVSAPRGYIRKYLKSLDSQTIANLSLRLEGLGHSSADVSAFFSKKFPGQSEQVTKQKAQLSQMYETNWEAEEVFLAYPDDVGEENDVETEIDPIEMAQTIAANIPQPIVNVTVEAPEPQKPPKKIIKRDANGLIESIEDEDASEG